MSEDDANQRKILRNNDRKWKLILNNLKEVTSPGNQDWCINTGEFKRCVPDQLETHDGVPYNCLKRGGAGGYGEVLIYSRTDPNTGKEQKIAIKVMKYENDTECRNTSSYYNKFSENQWCPYVLVQKCITPEDGFYCEFRDIGVEIIAMEIMEETLDKFLKTHHSPKVKEAILRKIYIALLCVWEKGGVYSDMKPGNVMVNKVYPLENSLVKLVDLGSICTVIGGKDAICTFPPPHTWAFFNRGHPQEPTESGCTEKTLIWSFVIAALSVYAWKKWEKHWNILVFDSPNFPDTIVGDETLEYINKWMVYFEDLLDKENSNILTNVRKCLSPFGKNDWRDDWRTSSGPPPFKFSTMIQEFPPSKVEELKVEETKCPWCQEWIPDDDETMIAHIEFCDKCNKIMHHTTCRSKKHPDCDYDKKRSKGKKCHTKGR